MLLKSVSRSFYLSLKFLPPPVRGPLSLGYLLARASDTLADTAEVSAEARLAALAAFRNWVEGGTLAPLLQQIPSILQFVRHEGEKTLLAQFGSVAAEYDAESPPVRRALQEVLGHILTGQASDVERFATEQPAAMDSAAALRQYTYWVAGSVGEFWTDVCELRLGSAQWLRTPADAAEMRLLGRTFGQGLQLVNVLRDLPADLAAGRCYLPLPELRAAGFDGDFSRWREQWPAFVRVRHAWSDVARIWLDAGRRYAENCQGSRLRFAVRMPWRLGWLTLDRLAGDETMERVKVPRSGVRRAALREAWRGLLW